MGEMKCPLCDWSGVAEGIHRADLMGVAHECPECGAYVSMGVWEPDCAACELRAAKGKPAFVDFRHFQQRRVLPRKVEMRRGKAADYFDGLTIEVFKAIPRVERRALYDMMTIKQRRWVGLR